MAYKLLIKKRFSTDIEAVFKYLKSEWSDDVALRFLELVEIRLAMLKEYPLLGASSEKIKNVRSISITKHNRLFYKLERQFVVILYLKDTRRKNYS